MNTNRQVTQVGFDRPVLLEWLHCAMLVRLGRAKDSELESLLVAAGLGKEAKAKTQTKINSLVLRPRADLASFSERGIDLIQDDIDALLPVYVWGMGLATYPFFANVVEIIGRLTGIQGECSARELQRRIGETYGNRAVCVHGRKSITRSLVDWGVLERSSMADQILRKRPKSLSGPMTVWIVEAVLRQAGRALPVASLPLQGSVFPFSFCEGYSQYLSDHAQLQLHIVAGQLMIALCESPTAAHSTA